MQFFAEQKMQKLPFHLKLITNFRKKRLRNRTVRYWIDEISVETNLWKHLKSTEHLFFLKLRDFLSIYNSNYSEKYTKKKSFSDFSFRTVDYRKIVSIRKHFWEKLWFLRTKNFDFGKKLEELFERNFVRKQNYLLLWNVFLKISAISQK